MNRYPNAADAKVDELLKSIQAGVKHLMSPSSLTDEVRGVPMEVATAFITGRPELLKAAGPRPLSTEECAALYKLIGTLIETNFALQAHAQGVAELVKVWMSSFKGMQNTAYRIEQFANFKPCGHSDAEDDKD